VVVSFKAIKALPVLLVHIKLDSVGVSVARVHVRVDNRPVEKLNGQLF
jgi:hypothetical protein